MKERTQYHRDYRRRKALEALMAKKPQEKFRLQMLDIIAEIGKRDFDAAEAAWHGFASWMEYPVYPLPPDKD